MKKICSTILLLLLLLSFSFSLAGCARLDFFKTEQFTEETFYSAIRKYGKKEKRNSSSKDYYYYFLTDEQAKAAYDNSTVKALLTSKTYASIPKDIKLWAIFDIMYEDIFSNNNSYTVESLFETVSKKCLISSSDLSYIRFYGSAIKYMAKNDSIVNLCKNNGNKIFAAFQNDNFELYIEDIIDLFVETDTFDNNASIACYRNKYSGYYPLAFESVYWYNSDWRLNMEGKSGFKNSSAYQSLVNRIKSKLKDPDSYQADGGIEFYSSSLASASDGYFDGVVYARVPFRAKNSFGGYVNDVAWFMYRWNIHDFEWYGFSAPSNINSDSFRTVYVN